MMMGFVGVLRLLSLVCVFILLVLDETNFDAHPVRSSVMGPIQAETTNFVAQLLLQRCRITSFKNCESPLLWSNVRYSLT